MAFGSDEEIGARLSLRERAQFSKDAERARRDIEGLGRTSETSARRAGSAWLRFRTRFGGVSRTIGHGAGIIVGALGAYGIGRAIKGVVSDSSDLQKIMLQTNAVLKSTHGAANISAKGVRNLANEINNYSMIDDDAVQSAENMLLTFRGVRNEVGKGNSIFTRGTKAAADMATALKKDVTQSAMMVGKALNDPIRGITALRKNGVAFTTEQQAQIKTLVESGKTMTAQKMILRELNSEFGGSARKAGQSFAGALFHIQDNLKDTARDLLMPALPTFTRWTNTLSDRVVPRFTRGLKSLRREFKDGDSTIGRTARVVGGVLRNAWDTGFGIIRDDIIPSVKNLIAFLQPELSGSLRVVRVAANLFFRVLKFVAGILKPLTGFIKDNSTWIKALAIGIGTIVGVYKAWNMAIKIGNLYLKAWFLASKLVTGAQLLLNTVMAANPILLVVAAVAGLAAGLIYAYKRSETFRRIVNAAFGAVKHAAQAVWGWLKDHWPLLLSILTGPFGAAVIYIIRHWDKVTGFIKGLPGKIKSVGEHIKNALVWPFQMAFHLIAVAWNNSAGKIGFHTPGWLGPLGHKGFSIPDIPDPGVPALASGGVANAMRPHWVGELGPEIFVPRVSGIVIPNHAIRGADGAQALSVPYASSAAGGGEMADGQPIVLQVVLDRKVVAEAVYTHTRGKVARQ